jgi:hypothetical protein
MSAQGKVKENFGKCEYIESQVNGKESTGFSLSISKPLLAFLF